MRKPYLETLAIALLLVLISLNGHATEYVKGFMTSSAISSERIQFVPPDRVSVSLGMKDGVIKGDILRIAEESDRDLLSPIGTCAVTKVDSLSSICEIVTASKEIGNGNAVFVKKLQHPSERFFLPIYSLLYTISNQYAPNKKITTYVHNVFDDALNVTAYSARIKGELENLFTQKSRILLKNDNILGKELQFYPGDAGENRAIVYDFMKKENIDTVVSAIYRPEGGSIKLTFYVYDRYFGDFTYPFEVKIDGSPDQAAEMKQVIASYSPVVPPERVACEITYSERTESVQKYGKSELADYEAAGNMFKQNDLRTRDFNVIAPTDITIMMDGEKINFASAGNQIRYIDKGKHSISVSFRRGYFFNSKEALVYASTNIVRKEMSLVVNKPGNLHIVVNLDPAFDSENVSFRVYKEALKVRSPIKPVEDLRFDKTVETFVD